MAEVLDPSSAFPGEHEIIRSLTLAALFEQVLDGVRHEHSSRLPVLGCAPVDADCPFFQINLPNEQIQQFRFAEAEIVSGGQGGFQPRFFAFD